MKKEDVRTRISKSREDRVSRPTAHALIGRLKRRGSRRNVEGMARFGINPKGTLGVPMPDLRGMAREIRRGAIRDGEGKKGLHILALKLWDSGFREARILASLLDPPSLVTGMQAEKWVGDFDSWDVCDQCCLNLFHRTSFAWRKTHAWVSRKGEFTKRAGFALMAVLAVHDRQAPDGDFIRLLPLIEKGAVDDRNFVRKAVNWALRQIGKRNAALKRKTVALSRRLARSDVPSARWVGKDALRELKGRVP